MIMPTSSLNTTLAPERIADLCQRSRDISLEKGWLNPDGTDPRSAETVFLLFGSEVSEAFEEYRDHRGLAEIYYEVKIKEKDGTTSKTAASPTQLADLEARVGEGWRELLDVKPCGIPIELADLIIRICQYVGSANASAILAESLRSLLPESSVDVPDSFDRLLADTLLHLVDAYVHEDVAPLAAAIYCVFAFAEAQRVDLWAAIMEKEAYNRTRPTRHGGKKV